MGAVRRAQAKIKECRHATHKQDLSAADDDDMADMPGPCIRCFCMKAVVSMLLINILSQHCEQRKRRLGMETETGIRTTSSLLPSMASPVCHKP